MEFANSTKGKEADSKTDKIRAMYATGDYSQKEISDKLGISRHSVRNRLRPEDKPAFRRLFAPMSAGQKLGIIQEWQSGDYSLDTLAERWGRKRKGIGRVLKAAGFSAYDYQYRNKRIGELMAAGYDSKTISERYSISEAYIVKLAWNGGGREYERICPVCKKTFSPRDRQHRYCTRGCTVKANRYVNICLMCGEQFPSTRASRKVCGRRCRASLAKGKTIAVSLRARELKRQGYTYKEITKKCGMSEQSLRNAFNNKKRSEYLAAIETVRMHDGKAWLSGIAKLEIRRAWVLLKAEGLDRYVREGLASKSFDTSIEIV